MSARIRQVLLLVSIKSRLLELADSTLSSLITNACITIFFAQILDGGYCVKLIYVSDSTRLASCCNLHGIAIINFKVMAALTKNIKQAVISTDELKEMLECPVCCININ